MSTNHIVQLPKAVWGIKVAQTVIAAFVLIFAIVDVAIYPYSVGYNIFTGIFSLIILAYFFVAINAKHVLYNWVALLVLECLAVIFWLSAWAAIASAMSAYAYVASYDDAYDGFKRDLSKRLTESTFEAAVALFYCVLALSIIEFILFCVTLGLMGKGIHNHRMAGKPMVSGQSGRSAFGNISSAEKNEMHPMSTGASSFSHGNNAPPANFEQQHQYPSAGYPTNGMPPTAHEAPGGNRY